MMTTDDEAAIQAVEEMLDRCDFEYTPERHAALSRLLALAKGAGTPPRVEVPTEPGWYWVVPREPHTEFIFPTVRQVYRYSWGDDQTTLYCNGFKVAPWGGRADWYGPLPSPPAL